jgi:glycosyltransferase involved in cell wall biosynthesis
MPAKFSIITCTWNSMPYLEESIASVLEQDCQDFEYIFVDGGSTDGTLELIRSVPRPYRLLENVRGGISAAMNAGLHAATGEIVAHIHSDDFYVRPDVLSIVAENMDASGKKWLFGRSMPMKNGILQNENWVAPTYTYANLLKANFIPHPATFVNRELLLQVGEFDTSLKYAMDYDLWLRLGRVADPVQLSIPLAAMREHVGSLTTRDKLPAFEEDYKVRRRHQEPDISARALHFLRYLVRRRRTLREVRSHA